MMPWVIVVNQAGEPVKLPRDKWAELQADVNQKPAVRQARLGEFRW